jgi:outer membrane lipoprotein-sorting protein
VKKTSALFFSCVFLSGTLAWAQEASRDDQAARELQRTLKPATVGYEGTMSVTHWYGAKTRTEDVRVRFNPPDHYRWEFLKPDGSIKRIAISDGENEVVHFVDNDKTLTGGAVKHTPRHMPADKEWALLRQNYSIEDGGPETIAGRPVLLIRVKPMAEGKLTQELGVDKETGVVLENKRFRLHGNYVVRSRFQRFVVVSSFPDGTFELAVTKKPLEDHQFAPDFLSRESWSKTTGRATTLPDQLPSGFVLESADTFLVDGKNVDHFRYTDGLCTVSIFQTKSRMKTKALERLSEQGNLMPFTKGDNHYMLVGDASVELLKEMTRAFP